MSRAKDIVHKRNPQSIRTGYLKLPGDYPVAKLTFQIHKLEKVAEGFVEVGE